MESIYNFEVKTIKGEKVSLGKYKGKTLLIVNTASKCGFTPQFEGLEELYNRFKDRGFVILGFPCNQFANQEPGDEQSIQDNCLLNYGVTFPMFSKIDVNGNNAHPLYKYLKDKKKGLLSKKIKWNFTKFLIDKEGQPIARFSPLKTPKDIGKYLEKYLG